MNIVSKKAFEMSFSNAFFDKTLLDMTWLKTQSLRLYSYHVNLSLIHSILALGLQKCNRLTFCITLPQSNIRNP